MKCYIYRSRKRAETYVYLRERDDFSPVPSELMPWFVNPVFVFELDLTPGRRLARADSDTVIGALEKKGFYLQLPPGRNRDSSSP